MSQPRLREKRDEKSLDEEESADEHAWWALRAGVINDYRRLRGEEAAVLNSRIDFERIKALAQNNQRATIFTEFSKYQRLGSRKAVVRIGSIVGCLDESQRFIDSGARLGRSLGYLLDHSSRRSSPSWRFGSS